VISDSRFKIPDNLESEILNLKSDNEVTHEGKSISQKNVHQVQGRAPQGSDPDSVLQPEA
jgi:hypothetical protein